jgi:hypothetical protein
MNLYKLNELYAGRAVHPSLKLSILFIGIEVEQKLLVSLVVNDPFGKLFGLVVTDAFVTHQGCYVCNFFAIELLTHRLGGVYEPDEAARITSNRPQRLTGPGSQTATTECVKTGQGSQVAMAKDLAKQQGSEYIKNCIKNL